MDKKVGGWVGEKKAEKSEDIGWREKGGDKESIVWGEV